MTALPGNRAFTALARPLHQELDFAPPPTVS